MTPAIQKYLHETLGVVPKVAGLVWNKPKAGTYRPIVVLYLNETNGHVESDVLSPFAGLTEVEAFASTWHLDEYQEKTVRMFRVARRVANGMSREEAIAKAGVPA